MPTSLPTCPLCHCLIPTVSTNGYVALCQCPRLGLANTIRLLRADLQAAEADRAATAAMCSRLRTDKDAAIAERDRLREALRKVDRMVCQASSAAIDASGFIDRQLALSPTADDQEQSDAG